jgi:hypothetical protein
MVFKFRAHHGGRHVHVDVFAAPDMEHTFAKNGALVLEPDEWLALRHLLNDNGLSWPQIIIEGEH